MLDAQDLEQIQEMISASERRMMVFYENVIQPQFQLLAEGHQTILETLTPKSRTEELEEEIQFLKSVLRSYGERIRALEAKDESA